MVSDKENYFSEFHYIISNYNDRNNTPLSNVISQFKDYSISVDQYRYATSVLAKYLYTATVNTRIIFYKTTFPYDMIFTKDDLSTSEEQVENLTRLLDVY